MGAIANNIWPQASYLSVWPLALKWYNKLFLVPAHTYNILHQLSNSTQIVIQNHPHPIMEHLQ